MFNSDTNPSDETNRTVTVTRRRALAAVAGASATGLGVTALASDPSTAQASVDIAGISVADGTYEAVDPTPTPVVQLAGTWGYRVDSDPAAVEATCTVAPPGGDPATVDSDRFETSQRAVETEFEFSGPVTEHEAFDAAAFAPDREASTEREVEVGVTVAVTDAAEATLVEASAADTAVVTVRNTGDAVDVTLTGDGAIEFTNTDE